MSASAPCKPLRPNSTPSQETVEKWITNGANYINAYLWEFCPPFTNSIAALRILLLINTDYASSRVAGATNQPRADELEARWREDLDKVRDGDIDIGLSRKATFIGGGTYYPSKPICPEEEDATDPTDLTPSGDSRDFNNDFNADFL